MTRSNDWTWEFRRPVTQVFEGLDAPIQQRIVSKLDDIVTDEWRDRPNTSNRSPAFHTGRSVSVIFASGATLIATVRSW